MTYTVQEAQEDFARLLKEADEGKEVVIARDAKPAVRLVPVSYTHLAEVQFGEARARLQRCSSGP